MRCAADELDLVMDADGLVAKGADDWGGMAVNFNRMPAGHDITELIRATSNGNCQVPHWGYVLSGSLQVGYTDGRVDDIRGGDVFYLEPGHDSVRSADGCVVVEFSPAEEQAAIVAEFMAVVAAQAD